MSRSMKTSIFQADRLGHQQLGFEQFVEEVDESQKDFKQTQKVCLAVSRGTWACRLLLNGKPAGTTTSWTGNEWNVTRGAIGIAGEAICLVSGQIRCWAMTAEERQVVEGEPAAR